MILTEKEKLELEGQLVAVKQLRGRWCYGLIHFDDYGGVEVQNSQGHTTGMSIAEINKITILDETDQVYQ